VDPTRLIERLRPALSEGDALGAMAALMEALRQGDVAQAPGTFNAICTTLETNPAQARALGSILSARVVEAGVGPALTESGIASDSSFTSELGRRIVRRFLPELEDPEDLRVVVRSVFDGHDDYQRIEAIPDALWLRFFEAIGIGPDPTHSVESGLETAIRTLAHHVGSLGMHPQFTLRLPHLDAADSPFLILTDRVLEYLRSHGNDICGDEPGLLDEALEAVGRCRDEVVRLRATKGQHGTSLELTGITFRLHQLLDRLESLLNLTRPDGPIHVPMARLLREIVVAEKTRNRLGPHFRDRADLLAFQVVEHAARKGSKYITRGRRDYGGFFLASLGGGFIVSVFSLFKTAMGDWTLPLGVKGLLYGLNYSLCFVLIYMSGAALATKQPAMTANTIAQALGEKGRRHLARLEILVVRVWRSQFVSFAGNLFMALPMAFLWSELFLRTTGETVATEADAGQMLQALHPWESGTVFFAAVAGVFLFLAGLLSGWVDNRNRYTHLPARVARHPFLNRTLGPGRSEAIAGYLDRHLGALAGNVFLGFALGSTGTVGEILGLPLDIRHIAFAAAEFGTSIEILNPGLAWSMIWPIVVGVGLIGLVNFLVSFGLSMMTALESRNITWRETKTLLDHLAKHFARRPTDWFFPPPHSPKSGGPPPDPGVEGTA
jgi:site-specific recombinase